MADIELFDNNNVSKSIVESTDSPTDASSKDGSEAEDSNSKISNGLTEDNKEPHARDTKFHQVQIWTEIRQSLRVVEDVMSSRVKKKVDVIKNEQESSVRKQLPPIEEARPGKGASEDDSEEEFYDLERSESDPNLDILSTDGIPPLDRRVADHTIHQESLPSWKEELECLVQGGVPMALRGEVDYK